jgi:hypothetical protein
MFFPRASLNLDFLLLALHVARIAGICHYTWLIG